MSLSISRLSFEHHDQAFGIAESRPRISWRFRGTVVDWEQTSYDMQLQSDGRSLHTYHIDTRASLYQPWPGEPLQTAEQVRVRVRAHGQVGQPSTAWSQWTTVEAGLLSPGDWGDAVPIAADRETEVDGPKRPIYFRNSFNVRKDVAIASARLYITALGVYEAEINGVRVGDHVLAPGWQSYEHRHVYNTHDVTEHLNPGDNGIGAIVGEGWYAGRLGIH